MKIYNLREYLTNILNSLSKYGDFEEVEIVGNTYFLKSHNNFIATKEGFIDLNNPVATDDEEDY